MNFVKLFINIHSLKKLCNDIVSNRLSSVKTKITNERVPQLFFEFNTLLYIAFYYKNRDISATLNQNLYCIETQLRFYASEYKNCVPHK